MCVCTYPCVRAFAFVLMTVYTIMCIYRWHLFDIPPAENSTTSLFTPFLLSPLFLSPLCFSFVFFPSLPFPYCFYFYLATPFSPIPFHSPSSPLLCPLSSFFFLMVSSKMSFLSIHAYLSTFHCIPLLLYTFIRP